jgi:hypothetical protein
MRRMKKALLGSCAAVLLAGGMLLGTTTPASAVGGGLTCDQLQSRYDGFITQSRVYHHLGNYYTYYMNFEGAAAMFALERNAFHNAMNVDLC